MRIVFFILMTIAFLTGVATAGSIKGTALYSLKFKPAPAIETGKFKKACGDTIPEETLLVDHSRLKNVVVTLSGKNLKGKSKNAKLDQKKCRYEPHVVAIKKESNLIISSSDPINHNIHTYSFENDPINVMFVPNQEPLEQEMEEAEIIKVECDLHSWMTAWIVVTDNSFYAVTNQKGDFEIGNVPPGKYKLTAWHESLGSIEKDLTVTDEGGTVDFDFSHLPTGN